MYVSFYCDGSHWGHCRRISCPGLLSYDGLFMVNAFGHKDGLNELIT